MVEYQLSIWYSYGGTVDHNEMRASRKHFERTSKGGDRGVTEDEVMLSCESCNLKT